MVSENGTGSEPELNGNGFVNPEFARLQKNRIQLQHVPIPEILREYDSTLPEELHTFSLDSNEILDERHFTRIEADREETDDILESGTESAGVIFHEVLVTNGYIPKDDSESESKGHAREEDNISDTVTVGSATESAGNTSVNDHRPTAPELLEDVQNPEKSQLNTDSEIILHTEGIQKNSDSGVVAGPDDVCENNVSVDEKPLRLKELSELKPDFLESDSTQGEPCKWTSDSELPNEEYIPEDKKLVEESAGAAISTAGQNYPPVSGENKNSDAQVIDRNDAALLQTELQSVNTTDTQPSDARSTADDQTAIEISPRQRAKFFIADDDVPLNFGKIKVSDDIKVPIAIKEGELVTPVSGDVTGQIYKEPHVTDDNDTVTATTNNSPLEPVPIPETLHIYISSSEESESDSDERKIDSNPANDACIIVDI